MKNLPAATAGRSGISAARRLWQRDVPYNAHRFAAGWCRNTCHCWVGGPGVRRCPARSTSRCSCATRSILTNQRPALSWPRACFEQPLQQKRGFAAPLPAAPGAVHADPELCPPQLDCLGDGPAAAEYRRTAGTAREVARCPGIHPPKPCAGSRQRAPATRTSRRGLRRDILLYFSGKQGLGIEEIAHRSAFPNPAFPGGIQGLDRRPHTYRKGPVTGVARCSFNLLPATAYKPRVELSIVSHTPLTKTQLCASSSASGIACLVYLGIVLLVITPALYFLPPHFARDYLVGNCRQKYILFQPVYPEPRGRELALPTVMAALQSPLDSARNVSPGEYLATRHRLRPDRGAGSAGGDQQAADGSFNFADMLP